MEDNKNFDKKKTNISKLKITRNVYLLSGSIAPLATTVGVMTAPPSFSTDTIMILFGAYITLYSFLNVHNINEDIKEYKRKNY